MEGLNTLLNQALGTDEESYIGTDGMKKCYDDLKKLSKSDKAALDIFLYFFPPNSSSEKNADSFWFIKYEKENNYNEYEFAKDLLKIYIQYKKEKNYKSFESKILEKVKSFKKSKLIGEFLSALETYDKKILAIISYITKDYAYFKETFEINMSSENIQTLLLICEVKHYLTQKKILLDFQKGLKIIDIYSKELNEVKSSNQIRENKMKQANERLENKLNNITNEVKLVKRTNEKLVNEIIELKDENSDLKKDNIRLTNVTLDL